jgi:hypothetical protein
MSGSNTFSGPPSNKATAATLAAAVATLFWTIAAHTFWKSMSTADLTLYIATSTVILTAIVGFAVPESAAYADYSEQRIANKATAQNNEATAQNNISAIPAMMADIKDLQATVQSSQQLNKVMADRLGIPSSPVITADGSSSAVKNT